MGYHNPRVQKRIRPRLCRCFANFDVLNFFRLRCFGSFGLRDDLGQVHCGVDITWTQDTIYYGTYLINLLTIKRRL